MVRTLIAAPAREQLELERRLRAEAGISLLPAGAGIAASRPEVILAAVAGRADPALPKLLEEAARGEAVILLVPEPDSGWESARRRGVRAVLPLDLSGPQLAAALAAAAAGLGVFYPSERALHSHARATVPQSVAIEEVLTPRELEALQWLAQGLGNKLIAARMGISEHTAKFHVAAILGKLGAASRTEAVALGLRRGLVLI